MSGLLFPKLRPKVLDTDDRKKREKEFDEKESAKAKARAKGRCEIFVVGEGRCKRRDAQTHHMLGGWGRRGKGESAKAERKQRVCDSCHRLITGHALKLLQDGPLPMWDDAYERIV